MDLSAGDPRTDGVDGPQPRVAVITVTYNRAHVLGKAIDSVLSQDYPHVRLVVVDDGSTDDTEALLKQYETHPRIQVVRHKANSGMLAARNTGLDNLTSEDAYFCYLDSDDTLVPSAVRTMVNAFLEHGDRYSMIWAASQDAETGQLDGSHSLNGREITFDDHLAGRIRGDYEQLVRHDLAYGLRHHPKAQTGEAVMWAQILRKKPALMIPDVVQLTDRSGADRMSNVRFERAYAESVMWARVCTLRAVGADMRRAYPQRYIALLEDLAKDAALAGDRRRARLASRQAMRLEPSLRTAMIACMALTPAWALRRCARGISRLRSSRFAGTRRSSTTTRQAADVPVTG